MNSMQPISLAVPLLTTSTNAITPQAPAKCRSLFSMPYHKKPVSGKMPDTGIQFANIKFDGFVSYIG